MLGVVVFPLYRRLAPVSLDVKSGGHFNPGGATSPCFVRPEGPLSFRYEPMNAGREAVGEGVVVAAGPKWQDSSNLPHFHRAHSTVIDCAVDHCFEVAVDAV